jgi:hypothetical protein
MAITGEFQGRNWVINCCDGALPSDCGDQIGQKGHDVRKSTSNSGQMGRIGQKQPEK